MPETLEELITRRQRELREAAGLPEPRPSWNDWLDGWLRWASDHREGLAWYALAIAWLLYSLSILLKLIVGP